MATLTINSEGFEKLRSENGLDTVKQLADALGVDKGTVSRIIAGKSAPGPTVISSVLSRFPVRFEDVFDVVGDDAEDAFETTDRDEAPVAA